MRSVGAEKFDGEAGLVVRLEAGAADGRVVVAEIDGIVVLVAAVERGPVAEAVAALARGNESGLFVSVEVPLADVAGGVSSLVKNAADGGLAHRKGHGFRGDTAHVRKPAGKDGRAGRGTIRVGGIGTVEPDSLGGEALQVRRADVGIAGPEKAWPRHWSASSSRIFGLRDSCAGAGADSMAAPAEARRRKSRRSIRRRYYLRFAAVSADDMIQFLGREAGKNMGYYIQRGDQQYGPYSILDLRRYVSEGNIIMSDMARREDSGEWVAVSQILSGAGEPPSPSVPAAPTPSPQPQPQWTPPQPQPQPQWSAPQAAAQPGPRPGAGPMPPDLHWALVLADQVFLRPVHAWFGYLSKSGLSRRSTRKTRR